VLEMEHGKFLKVSGDSNKFFAHVYSIQFDELCEEIIITYVDRFVAKRNKNDLVKEVFHQNISDLKNRFIENMQ